MKTKILFIFLAIFCTSELKAQELNSTRKEHQPSLGFGMQLGFPRDDFDRIYDREAIFGLGGRFMFPLDQKIPVDAGIQFYYMWMGTEKKTSYFQDINYGNYEVQSKVHGSMVPIHANLRLRPLRNVTSTIDPYVEGLVGFRIFNVTTEVQVDDYSANLPDPERTRMDNWVGSYGFATGAAIEIAQNIKLDFRYSKLWGGSAKYLNSESISFDNNGNPTYNRQESKTNLSNYEVGIVFVF